MNIQLSEIYIPTPLRINFGRMEEMKQSILNQGLIHPIVVKQITGNPPFRYELIAGYRRLQTARDLGWTHIPATILSPKDSLAQFDLSLSENTQRKDFDPLELCDLLFQRKLLWEQIHGPIKTGPAPKDESFATIVAKFYAETSFIFKKHPTEIRKLLQLKELDDDLKAKLEAGEIYYRVALSEQSKRNNPRKQKTKKKSTLPAGVPTELPDYIHLHHEIQKVVMQISFLFDFFERLNGREYDLSALTDERLGQLVYISNALISHLTKFNVKTQETILQKIESENP